MGEAWMPVLEFGLTAEEFRRLPRHPAYGYEHHKERARLIPCPRYVHAVLDLDVPGSEGGCRLRPATKVDAVALAEVFAAAFETLQPYCSLLPAERMEAARQALERTCAGGDGPWVGEASFVALDGHDPIGAVWITLLPDGEASDWQSYRWTQPPPVDCVSRGMGRPHLTWIFVAPAWARKGVGTGLLKAAGAALRRKGYRQLVTTIMSGNEPSLLWHWLNGFRLVRASAGSIPMASLPS